MHKRAYVLSMVPDYCGYKAYVQKAKNSALIKFPREV
jgi:hypothetical protein